MNPIEKLNFHIASSPSDVELDRVTAKYLTVGHGAQVARRINGQYIVFGYKSPDVANFTARRMRDEKIIVFCDYSKYDFEENISVQFHPMLFALDNFFSHESKYKDIPVSFLYIETEVKTVLDAFKKNMGKGTVICLENEDENSLKDFAAFASEAGKEYQVLCHNDFGQVSILLI